MPQIKREKTSVLSVSLPKKLKQDIIKYAENSDLTVSQFTKTVMRTYLLRSELERLQGVFGPALKKLGIKTEDDVEEYFG